MLRKMKLSGLTTLACVFSGRGKKSISGRDIFLSILSPILLILSFPAYNIEFLAWIGFVPLFFALERKTKSQAFFLAYITGFIFWAGIIYWLVHVTVIGTIILCAYLALYFGIFGLVSLSSRIITIAAGWILLEYARSYLLTGFPWALLGYSQHLNLPVIQIADITGVWGVSFVILSVNYIIYIIIRYPLSVVQVRKYIAGLLCVIFTLMYGTYRLYHLQQEKALRHLSIAVVQGNIPQELKWSFDANNYIMDRYLSLSLEAVKNSPDLIIWPEASLPVVLEEEPEFFERVKSFAQTTKTPLLLGAVTMHNSAYYNSAFLLSAQGKEINRYDKLHLVPFGEYIPLRRLLPFLETVVPIGDFKAGSAYTVFDIAPQADKNHSRFGVLICFEDLFPGLSRRFVAGGADFLVNITNDGWFKKTSSPYQHMQASVFRAVENRVYVVRSANTGVSAFIAPSGKILSRVSDRAGEDIFVSGQTTTTIAITGRKNTIYNRYGDIFIYLCFAYIIFFYYVRLYRTSRRSAHCEGKNA